MQRSQFIANAAEYFCLSLARPLVLTPDTNTSVTLGFQLDAACKETVRFWNDPAIPRFEINEACKRCGLADAACRDHTAAPQLYEHEQLMQARHGALERLMAAVRAT